MPGTASPPRSAITRLFELQLDIDDAEHERRRAVGLTAATGHGFGGLDVLMALPHGFPVLVADLTDHQRAYVRGPRRGSARSAAGTSPITSTTSGEHQVPGGGGHVRHGACGN